MVMPPKSPEENPPAHFQYKIERPCLWFAKGDRISIEKFQAYFTPAAVESLLANRYIKIIPGINEIPAKMMDIPKN